MSLFFLFLWTGCEYIFDGGQVGLCFCHGDIVAIRSFGLVGIAVILALEAFVVQLEARVSACL